VPQVIITDKLKSYSAAKQGIVPGVEHWQHRYSTTVRRTPITRPAGGSGACRALNHRVMSSTSSQPRVSLPSTSGRDATFSPSPNIIARCSKDASPGRTSRASQLRPNGRDGGRHVFFCQISMLTRNKLAMSFRSMLRKAESGQLHLHKSVFGIPKRGSGQSDV
jgi:hypothetical protein